MSPERDTEDPDRDGDRYEEEDAPRSIFAAMWFRAVLVVLVLGVIGVVAVPYLLDFVNPPVKTTSMKSAPRPASPPVSVTTPPTPPPETAPTTPPATSTMTATPAKPPATSAPQPAAPRPETAPTAKRATTPKPEMAKEPAAKTAPARKTAARSATTVAKATPPAAGGSWFVQVGAFRDEAAARRLLARLRAQHYPVAETIKPGGTAAGASPAPSPAAAASPGDRYDVFVTGGSPRDVNEKVASKGLAAESVAGGVVVKPSLPLRDAVALSRDLATEGLKVQVRRAGSAAAAPSPAASSASGAAGAGARLYRVRVGGFHNRALAMTALRELEAKGYKPFIARGTE